MAPTTRKTKVSSCSTNPSDNTDDVALGEKRGIASSADTVPPSPAKTQRLSKDSSGKALEDKEKADKGNGRDAVGNEQEVEHVKEAKTGNPTSAEKEGNVKETSGADNVAHPEVVVKVEKEDSPKTAKRTTAKAPSKTVGAIKLSRRIKPKGSVTVALQP